MMRDPLEAALPCLRREAAVAVRLARIDLLLAIGLSLVGILGSLSVFMAPLHGSMLLIMLQLHLAVVAGVGLAIWAAIVLETSGPRLMAGQRIIRNLRGGATLEALELALRALPVPGGKII
jgi:hypothetical protein